MIGLDSLSVNDVLRALACGRRGCECGRGRMTHCPAHDDPKPSLSVDKGEKQDVVVCCRAGCEQRAVLAALHARGLWPERGHKTFAQTTAPTKPTALDVRPEHIPPELKRLSRWVCWRWEQRGGKWTKPPCDPRSGQHADSTKPPTWASFEDALAAYQRGEYDGIGFVLTEDGGGVAVDLDHVRDPDTGSIEPWAADVVRALDSYAEVSPSGTGLRVLARAKLPPEGRKRGPVEVYEHARYVTLTGHRLPGAPATIERRQAEIDAFHAQHFPPREHAQPRPSNNGVHPLSDDEVLQLAVKAKNGQKVAAVYHGSNEGYPSDSEADMWLVSALAFYTQDRAQLDRLFRQSPRMRPKWDEGHASDGRTYGEITIDKALFGLRETYSPRAEANGKTPSDEAEAEPPKRRLRLTPASAINPRPVRWAWDTAPPDAEIRDREGRLPVGSLAIAVGHAGIGKSQFGVWMAAHVTRGTLPGCFYGEPRGVIFATREDSWEMTIVPRLLAAGADLDRVYRVDVEDDGAPHTRVTLPKDTDLLADAIAEHDVALVVLDPLLSLLHDGVDDYRAKEVREALEPVVEVADNSRALFLGLAHFTKASGNDPLLLVSGSAAFGQLVRAALGFARDEESGDCVVSTIKNNLGREDLPSLGYRIEPRAVDTAEGVAWVSRFEFTEGEPSRSVADILSEQHGRNGKARIVTRAVLWLTNYLRERGGEAPRTDVLAAGKSAGYGKSALDRAREEADITYRSEGFPRTTIWALSVVSNGDSGNGRETTEATVSNRLETADNGPQSSSRRTPHVHATTATTATTDPACWLCQSAPADGREGMCAECYEREDRERRRAATCHACGGGEFWTHRDGRSLCATCHPEAA